MLFIKWILKMAHHNKFTQIFLYKKIFQQLFFKNICSKLFLKNCVFKNIFCIFTKNSFRNGFFKMEHHNKFTQNFLNKKIFKHLFFKKTFSKKSC